MMDKLATTFWVIAVIIGVALVWCLIGIIVILFDIKELLA